ncbi:MAG: dephospho-CoA kinase [Chlorobium sp.]|nr:dephospho-CoA kinase [Chlorobium phaeovibrioides]NQU45809.1 dephospho-CoA kinase [Chlorobium sp.]
MTFPRPFLVGVTGGIGSGKSSLCTYLAQGGCEVFEADRVAKDLQERDAGVIEGMQSLFGKDIYSINASGALVLDRKRVAAEVFSYPAKLGALNSLVHPVVREEFRRFVQDAGIGRKRIVVLEAAILFESEHSSDMDFIVVVAADDDIRLKRATGRGRSSADDIKKRMAMQWPQELLIEKSDYVVMNNGSKAELKQAALELIPVLEDAAEMHSAGNRPGKRGK